MMEIGRLSFGGHSLIIGIGEYSMNRRLAVAAWRTGATTVTASISEHHFEEVGVEDNEFVAQTRNFPDGLCDALLRCGKFEDTGRVHAFGPHIGQQRYKTIEPIWRLII